MNKPRFQFGQVVVVDDDLIGVVCKTWQKSRENTYSYEVYVRTYNSISEYLEGDINHYIYNKELSEEEKEFYY